MNSSELFDLSDTTAEPGIIPQSQSTTLEEEVVRDNEIRLVAVILRVLKQFDTIDAEDLDNLEKAVLHLALPDTAENKRATFRGFNRFRKLFTRRNIVLSQQDFAEIEIIQMAARHIFRNSPEKLQTIIDNFKNNQYRNT